MYRLKKTSMLNNAEPKISVDVVQKPGKIIQKQIVVTVSQKMELPLSSVWGSNSNSTVTVEGRADCLDLLEYFNLVDTVKGMYDATGIDKDLAIIGKIDKWIQLYNKFAS